MLRFRLNTVADVRRSLARVINMTANGQMDPKTANCIILGCNAILQSVRLDDQEKKLDELERCLKDLEERQ